VVLWEKKKSREEKYLSVAATGEHACAKPHTVNEHIGFEGHRQSYVQEHFCVVFFGLFSFNYVSPLIILVLVN